MSNEEILYTNLEYEELSVKLKKWLSYLNDQAWKTDTGIVGSFNKFMKKMTVYYRFRQYEFRTVCTNQKYHIVVKIQINEDNKCSIRYFYAHDKMFSAVMKINGILCFIPLIYFWVNPVTQSPLWIIIFIYSILGLFAVLGLFLIFSKFEKPEEGYKAYDIFEYYFKYMF